MTSNTEPRDHHESSPLLVPHSTQSSTDSNLVNNYTDWLRKCLSFIMMALAGMSDASIGAQLVEIQSHYHLSYSHVSLVFLANVVGCLLASILNPFFLHMLGLGPTVSLGALIHALGALTIALQPSFLSTTLALMLQGFGAEIMDSTLSTYIAFLRNPTVMSIFYGSFNFGQLLAPLLIAFLLDNTSTPTLSWSTYYYLPFLLSLLTAPLSYLLFRSYLPPPDEEGASAYIAKRMLQVLRKPVLLLGGLLVALSFASADILASWFISFMTTHRSAPPSSTRFLLSPFWAGQALGRFLLPGGGGGPTNSNRSSIATMLTLYLSITLALLAVFQFWENVIADATAMILVGVFLGPIMPIITLTTTSLVPSSLVPPVVSWLTALGLIGAAAGPLLFGLAAESLGALRWLGAVEMGVVGVMIGCCVVGGGLWRSEKEG